MVLEPQIAALAAERATDAELVMLEDTIQRQHDAIKDGRLGLREDTRFISDSQRPRRINSSIIC